MDMLPGSTPMPQANDAAPDDQGSGTEDFSQGMVIEITVKADGSITVGAEPLAEEAGEDQGTGGQPAMGGDQEGASESGQGDQPASNWQEAMQIASDLYKNKGQLPQGGADLRKQLYDQAPGQRP